MGNLHNPVKFMTFHATFKVHGKNQTILKFMTLQTIWPYLFLIYDPIDINSFCLQCKITVCFVVYWVR